MENLKNQNYQEFMHTNHFNSSNELDAFILIKCENHNTRTNSSRVCRLCEVTASIEKYHRTDMYKLCTNLSCKNRQLNKPCYKISKCDRTNVSDFYESRKHETETKMCVTEDTASSKIVDACDAMSVDSTETDVLKPGLKIKTIQQHLSVAESHKRKNEITPEKIVLKVLPIFNPSTRYILPKTSQQDQRTNSSISSIVTAQSNKPVECSRKISQEWIKIRLHTILQFKLFISLIDESLKKADCILTHFNTVLDQIKAVSDEDTAATDKFVQQYEYKGDVKQFYLSSYIIGLFCQLVNLPLDMQQNYLGNISSYFDGLSSRYWEFEKWKIKRKCTIASLEKLVDVIVNDGKKYNKIEIEKIVKETRTVVVEDHNITNELLSTISNYKIGDRVGLKIDLINLVNTCGNFDMYNVKHADELRVHLNELRRILVEDLFFDIIFI